MRRAGALLLAAGALLGAPAAASAASVDVFVVGKERELSGPREVALKKRRAKVGGRSCAVGAGTPLSALLGARVRLAIRDYGSCGRSTRDAGGLFVTKVGPDRNRGQDGWVYKVGRRAGTTPAADPSGPFGTGRGLRDGQRVLWFWCVLSAGEACQRTLEASPSSTTVAPGGTLKVRVKGYDDAGRGIAVEGATVRLGDASAVTGADGAATITAPADASRAFELTAEREGMVRSFPREVRVR